MKVEVDDREKVLRVKGHMYEIEKINDSVIGGRQGWPMAEGGYKNTLLSVAGCADKESIDEVAAHIKGKIEKEEERPPNRKIRRIARKVVTEKGYPAAQYLNRA